MSLSNGIPQNNKQTAGDKTFTDFILLSVKHLNLTESFKRFKFLSVAATGGKHENFMDHEKWNYLTFIVICRGKNIWKPTDTASRRVMFIHNTLRNNNILLTWALRRSIKSITFILCEVNSSEFANTYNRNDSYTTINYKCTVLTLNSMDHSSILVMFVFIAVEKLQTVPRPATGVAKNRKWNLQKKEFIGKGRGTKNVQHSTILVKTIWEPREGIGQENSDDRRLGRITSPGPIGSYAHID